MMLLEQRREAGSPASDHRIPWGWAVGTTLGLEVALVGSAFAWVAIYSYLIHPGETVSFYQRYAQVASPVVSVVLGIPYWFFACRWVGRKVGSRAVAMSLTAWCIAAAIDLILISLVPENADWIMEALSLSTKLLAAYAGGKAALKERA